MKGDPLGYESGEYRVVLNGELDLYRARRVALTLDRALASSAPRIVLDLASLTFIDSSGLRVFSTAARRARDDGVQLVVEGARGHVSDMLRLSGLALPQVDGNGATNGRDGHAES